MQKKKERDVYSVKCEREQIDSKSSMAMDCLAVLHSKLFLFGQLIWRCCAQLFYLGKTYFVAFEEFVRAMFVELVWQCFIWIEQVQKLCVDSYP